MNSSQLAQKMAPIVDEIYTTQSVTAQMDTPTMVEQFNGVNQVQVLKVSTTGLGDYSRENGYPAGDVTASWETMTLTEERGKELSVDRMDNEETLGLTFGTVIGDFESQHVIPELDAYRFAKYASKSGILTTSGAVLTKDTIIAAIDEAVRALDAEQVPKMGRKLYISSDLQPLLNGAVSRQWGSDGSINTVLQGYNGMTITYVLPTVFYTGITLNPGTSSWGYVKGTGAADINFMIVYPKAVVQVKKFAKPKVFDPDTNQGKDAWKYQFRLYHDAFVYDNKVKGIYLHKKPTV
jgi:hypothetical protein